jgi:hypothetical protein
MKYFCTLSDSGYLLKGLVLYESLLKHSPDGEFKLYYLCLDKEIYEKLLSIDPDRLIPIKLSDLLEADSELSERKNKLKYNEFCWGLASYYMKYLLGSYPREIDVLCYVDSDIAFTADYTNIFVEFGSNSIGIIRHRHVPRGHFVGEYNVGIVVFRNDDVGRECVKFWSDCALDKSNLYYNTHGSCGDQKYLELFEEKFSRVKILDTLVGHGAPFNFELYTYNKIDEGFIFYNNVYQKLIFIHFMQFTPNFVMNTYLATREPHNQKFMEISEVKKMYDDYMFFTIKIKEKYNL